MFYRFNALIVVLVLMSYISSTQQETNKFPDKNILLNKYETIKRESVKFNINPNSWNMYSRLMQDFKTIAIIDISNNRLLDSVSGVLHKLNKAHGVGIVILSNYSKIDNIFQIRDILYFLATQSVDNVWEFFEHSKYWRYFKPRARYIVLHFCEKKMLCENNNLIYTDVLNRIWDKTGALKVLVHTINSKSLCLNKAFTFSPFLPSNSTTFGRGYNVDVGKISLDRLFSDKLTNLNGHHLRVTLFPLNITLIPVVKNGSPEHYLGRDGRMLEALASYLNFVPDVISPTDGATYGYRLKNGTYTGTLGHLIYDKADLSINGRYIQDHSSEDVEFASSAVSNEELCVMVPRVGKMPHVLGIIYFYSWEYWLVLTLTNVGMSTVWAVMRMFQSDYPHLSPLENGIIIMNIWISNPIEKFRKYSRSSQRMLLATCMLSSIVIFTIITGSIYKVLNDPSFYDDLTTLEDLDRSGLPIVIYYRSMMNIFDDSDSDTMKSLGSKLSSSKDPLVLTHLVDHKNLSCIATKSLLIHLILTTRNGAYKMTILKECPRTYGVSYLVPKRSPFTNEFHKIITRLTEGGFVVFWRNEALHFLRLAEKIDLEPYSEESSARIFSIDDLKSVFIFLVIGLVISGVTYLTEIWKHRVNKKYTKQNILQKKLYSVYLGAGSPKM